MSMSAHHLHVDKFASIMKEVISVPVMKDISWPVMATLVMVTSYIESAFYLKLYFSVYLYHMLVAIRL